MKMKIALNHRTVRATQRVRRRFENDDETKTEDVVYLVITLIDLHYYFL